jgi:hypothetical protein
MSDPLDCQLRWWIVVSILLSFVAGLLLGFVGPILAGL